MWKFPSIPYQSMYHYMYVPLYLNSIQHCILVVQVGKSRCWKFFWLEWFEAESSLPLQGQTKKKGGECKGSQGVNRLRKNLRKTWFLYFKDLSGIFDRVQWLWTQSTGSIQPRKGHHLTRAEDLIAARERYTLNNSPLKAPNQIFKTVNTEC